MTPATRSLLRAAATGDIALIRGLLAQDTDVNCVTAAGQTPLMLAAGFNHEEAVRVLLSAGAFVHAQDELGLTALDWAANFTNIRELISATINTPVEENVGEIVLNANASTGVHHVDGLSAGPVVQSTPTTRQQPPFRTLERSDDAYAPRVTLGGLAGAILRERVAKTASSTQSPAEALPDTPVSSIPAALETETTIQSDAAWLDSTSAETRKPIPALTEDTNDPSTETISHDVEINDDNQTREIVETSLETSPSIAPMAVRQSSATNTRSRDPSSERLKPLSKFHVEVPSFKIMPVSSRRPFVWVLIIIFLGGAAFGAFQLSRYLLTRTTNDSQATVTSDPNSRNNPLLVKSSPVVGGNLAGTDLFVPDAEYPTDTATSQSGNVLVLVQVNQRGIVLSAKATEGPEVLRAAAEKAGKLAAFSSAKLRGKGRVVNGTITYSFVPPQPAAQSPSASNNQPSAATSPGAAQAAQSSGTDNLPSVGGPLYGAALKLPQPDYPDAAKNAGITGAVTVVVRVNRAGRVVSWRTLDGDTRLRAAALKAARQATFSPAKLRGNDEVVGTITYTFGSP